jgi:hypothetical protein
VQNRIDRTRQAKMGQQNWTRKTEQEDWPGRTRLAEQGCKDGVARIRQPGHVSQERTAWKGQLEEGRQKSIGRTILP